MTIDAVGAVDGYGVHTQLLHGEYCREHQVGLIHEVESLRKSASGGIISQ